MRLLVLSTTPHSDPDAEIIRDMFSEEFHNKSGSIDCTKMQIADALLPQLSINSVEKCARITINEYKQKTSSDSHSSPHPSYEFIVSIHHGVELNQNEELATYVCCIIIETPNKHQYTGFSRTISFLNNMLKDAMNNMLSSTYQYSALGIDMPITDIVGSIMPKQYNQSIMDALTKCFVNYWNGQLKESIKFYPDFPKKGVIFQHLSDILANGQKLHLLVDNMVRCVNESGLKPTKIVGLDARGFIYGPLLAYALGIGFVMARKPGKLPGKIFEVEYGTEYSKDKLILEEGVIDKTDKILLVDDLIATGGSFEAADKLVQMAGGTVIGYLAILKVDALLQQAKTRLTNGPIIVVL